MRATEFITEDLRQALQFATDAHKGQTRSGGEPYIGHPVRVAQTIEKYKQSHNLDELIAAAYLHDTIEDTGTTHEDLKAMFGGLVASLVQELTSDKEKIAKMGKSEYLAQKMAHDMSSWALVIKLADRLDNVQDIATAKSPAWRAKYKAETEHILDYIEKNRVLSGTHKQLVGMIRDKLKEIPVANVNEEAKAVKTDSLVLKYAFNDSALLMKAFERKTGSPLAFVKFVKEKKELYPENLWVHDEYRNRGIAKTMYDTLKSEGYVINRSHDQTKAGSGFWDKHRGEDAYVWEEESVNESFTTKVPYEVDYANPDSFQTSANIGNRIVKFGGAIAYPEEPYVWEVAFDSTDDRGRSKYHKTGEGNEMQVFSFVLDSMKELVARYRPLEIRFASSKADENRTSLYTRLIKRFPIEGYSFVGVQTRGKDDEFVIKRNDNLDEEVLDEMPLPADWDPSQMRQQGTTFKSRLAYALERAKKLGAGSSRVAMTIEYEGRPTVLKVAKNQKGLAQNSVEADILSDGYARQLGILIPIIDYDEQNREPTWVHTEMAQKATEKQLCQLMGCDNLAQLVNMAWAITGKKKSVGDYQSYVSFLRTRGVTEEQIDKMTEYANDLAELNSNFDIELGDFPRAANWGIYQGKPVIIDVGFNSNVLDQFYKR